MHDPIGALSIWGATNMENQRLFRPYWLAFMVYGSVLPGGFPIASTSGTVQPRTVAVLLIYGTEEVPFLVS
ncbi:hypothetical protein HanRHA438_Chr15g0717501 [Helianthus annuus]|nr:hypothetical protein HanRHA438_Chr15g0717501 [Helianthus annuus]